jgi:hypothetical protein
VGKNDLLQLLQPALLSLGILLITATEIVIDMDVPSR